MKVCTPLYFLTKVRRTFSCLCVLVLTANEDEKLIWPWVVNQSGNLERRLFPMKCRILSGACQSGSILPVSLPRSFWYFGFWSLHDLTVQRQEEKQVFLPLPLNCLREFSEFMQDVKRSKVCSNRQYLLLEQVMFKLFGHVCLSLGLLSHETYLFDHLT